MKVLVCGGRDYADRMAVTDALDSLAEHVALDEIIHGAAYEPAIIRIEAIEKRAGIKSKGNARVMFSPKRHNGAIGIRAVVEDAKHGHDDMFEPAGRDPPKARACVALVRLVSREHA